MTRPDRDLTRPPARLCLTPPAAAHSSLTLSLSVTGSLCLSVPGLGVLSGWSPGPNGAACALPSSRAVPSPAGQGRACASSGDAGSARIFNLHQVLSSPRLCRFSRLPRRAARTVPTAGAVRRALRAANAAVLTECIISLSMLWFHVRLLFVSAVHKPMKLILTLLVL